MDTGGSSVPREPGPRSAFQLDPAPHARTSHHTVPRGLRRLTTRDSDGVGRAGKGPATRGTSANIQQSHDNAQPPAKKGNRRPPPDRRPIEPGRRRDSVRPDSRLKLAPTGFAPLQLPRAYQRRKYLGPMDGYKPHKILIWIIFPLPTQQSKLELSSLPVPRPLTSDQTFSSPPRSLPSSGYPLFPFPPTLSAPFPNHGQWPLLFFSPPSGIH
jgi:hypothetical protein